MLKKSLMAFAVVFVIVGWPSIVCAEGIYMGLAKTEITPPIGGDTTGYASAKPTTAVHDPLYAKVMILQSSETTLAIVSWDLCVSTSPWLHSQMPELGIDHLLILNTHTHAGPNLNQDDFPSPEKPWRKTVEERILQTIREAKSHLFRAYIAVGAGSIQLGYNRLVRQPEGYAITHFENPERIPYGPVDPSVGVIRITDDQGAIRAVLVCYACHPVVLGPKNRSISADYPGVLCREVEQELGEGVQCIFVQGGAGDINPLIMARTGDPELDFPLVEKMGVLLSEEVLKTVQKMKDKKGTSESFSYKSKILEAEHRFAPGETVSVSVTSLLLNNDIGVVTMPGEPFHLFQSMIREKSDLPHAFLFGYCDDAGLDWARYLPDLESAARGGYGASDTTIAAVGTGERLVNQGLVMLYELRGRLLDKPQRHLRD